VQPGRKNCHKRQNIFYEFGLKTCFLRLIQNENFSMEPPAEITDEFRAEPKKPVIMRQHKTFNPALQKQAQKLFQSGFSAVQPAPEIRKNRSTSVIGEPGRLSQKI
jgi:hypothetical protein